MKNNKIKTNSDAILPGLFCPHYFVWSGETPTLKKLMTRVSPSEQANGYYLLFYLFSLSLRLTLVTLDLRDV